MAPSHWRRKTTAALKRRPGCPRLCPQNDVRVTAHPGDVMLYQGDTVVLFYGSNTWAYTKLARITETEGLEAALSGGETAFTLSLQP